MMSIPVDDIGIFFSQDLRSYLLIKNKQKYLDDYALDEIEGPLDPESFFVLTVNM